MLHFVRARACLRSHTKLIQAAQVTRPINTSSCPPGVTVVNTKEDARRVVKIIESLPPSTYHAWDTEVMAIDAANQSPVGNGRIICASFYSGPKVNYGSGPKVWVANLDESEGVLDEFKGVLESKDIKKVWHNYGFDRHVLYNHGIDARGLGGDTMHMARMWNTARALSGGYSLEGLTTDLLQRKKTGMKEIFAKPKLKKDGTPGKEMVLPPLEDIQRDENHIKAWIDYSTYDAEATWLLRELLEQQLRNRHWVAGRTMWDFYQEYIVPFAECLTDLERAGIFVDVKNHLPAAEKLALMDRIKAEESFLQWASSKCPDAHRMNVSSDVQKAHFLFAPCTRLKPNARRGLVSSTKVKAGTKEAAIKPAAKSKVAPNADKKDNHPLAAREIHDSTTFVPMEAEPDAQLVAAPPLSPAPTKISRARKPSAGGRSFGTLSAARRYLTYKSKFPTFVPASASSRPAGWGRLNYGSSDSEDTDQVRALFGEGSDFELDDDSEKIYFVDPADESSFSDPALAAKPQRKASPAVPPPDAKDADSWPAARTFAVENLEGYIEPGKKAAKVKRDIVLVGLGIPPVARTESGWPAVSSTVLKTLAGKVEGSKPQYGLAYEYFGGGEDGKAACEALHCLYTISTIDTMLSNFIIPLQLMADKDSRVHCSLNLNTETGRLSARRPSLQNQPALEKDRYGVRKAFMASQGNKLIVADYGQLELRLLAHMAKCKSMLDAFKAGGDFHSRTAMGMYSHVADAVAKGEVLLEWDENKGEAPAPLLKNVFSSERRKAKILNFSIAYGKTAMGLAKDWNVSLDEAKETLEKWYSDRPEVREWQKRVLEEARRERATRTLLGRYRDLPEIASTQWRLRGHAERAAINTPIQGGAADVAMMAMLKLWRNQKLWTLGWKMLLQIHDEVILEGPAETATEALALVKDDMEHPFERPLLVDLVVDANIADNWYDAK